METQPEPGEPSPPPPSPLSHRDLGGRGRPGAFCPDGRGLLPLPRLAPRVRGTTRPRTFRSRGARLCRGLGGIVSLDPQDGMRGAPFSEHRGQGVCLGVEGPRGPPRGQPTFPAPPQPGFPCRGQGPSPRRRVGRRPDSGHSSGRVTTAWSCLPGSGAPPPSAHWKISLVVRPPTPSFPLPGVRCSPRPRRALVGGRDPADAVSTFFCAFVPHSLRAGPCAAPPCPLPIIPTLAGRHCCSWDV